MSMGLQTYNADGSIGLNSLSRPPRLIFFEMFDYDFTGTRNVPSFDDTKGFISVSLGLHKARGYPYFDNVPDSTVMGANTYIWFDGISLPTLNWNNTTKLLNISPAAPAPTGDGGLAGGDGTDDTVNGKANFSIYMVATG